MTIFLKFGVVLNSVPINYFVEGVVFGEVTIQKFEELSSNACFHIARIWGVPPGDVSPSLAFFRPIFGLLGVVG